MADLKALGDAVIKGDANTAIQITKDAIAEGMPAEKVLNEGMIAGMNILGVRFKNNEVYIPEVLIAARAMKMAMQVLEPELVKAGVQPVGKFVIGTVKGDLHDIGKNLVAMMMKGAGFDVIDLGVDVPESKFIEKTKASGAILVGMSTLLTTTMPSMEKTLKAIKSTVLNVKVMIGGAPVTQSYADKIGADGYAADAATAVDVAKRLIA